MDTSLSRSAKLAVVLLVAGVLAAAWYFFGASLSWASLVDNERALRDVISRHPLPATVAGTLLYIATSLIPGTTGKSIAFGWLFGFWIGLCIVSLSLTAAAVIAMLTIRRFFREWAKRRVPRIIAKINAALQRGGEASCLLTLRLLHTPYTGVNYSSGATDVRVSTFAWTTLVGMMPSNLVFVLAGSRLPSLSRLDEVDPSALIDWQLLVVASIVIAIPLLISYSTRG